MRTILIIEDDISYAELIKERVEKKGHKAIIAYSGKSAISTVTNTKPDAITLDIHLPDISGIEVLKKFKENNVSIPVIIVTCDDTKEKECKDYKVRGFIKKPVNFNQLFDVINLATS